MIPDIHRILPLVTVLLSLSFSLCALSPHPVRNEQESRSFRFLALGDSYTIGEKVSREDGWPARLARSIRDSGIPLAPPRIIARTGWTTGELLSGIEREEPQGPYDLVTLLIGVNNQYRRYRLPDYRLEFRLLLKKAIHLAGGHPKRVLVLSIPDWGATLFAEKMDRKLISRRIRRFNRANRRISRRLSVHYSDITPISLQAAGDPSLVASDGLHPSGRMYGMWVDHILSTVLQILQKRRSSS